MADKEELKGNLIFDTTNAVAGITELNRNIKILDTGFKGASAGIQNWSSNISANEVRIETLSGIIDLQRQKVANLTAEYEKAKTESGANSTSAQNLAIAVNKAQGALNKSQGELKTTTENLKKLETEQKKQPSLWSQMADSAQKSGTKTNEVTSAIKSQFTALKGALIGIFAGFSLKGLITSAATAEDNMAQLEARMKSTGKAAGVTESNAVNLATGLSKVTTYSKQDVLSAENLLLTFTKIGKNIFPQATEATLNLATAMKEDTRSAAIQLGKALNEPVTGAVALRRVGVQLTDSQVAMVKAMVKAGDVAGAQKVIMNELATETGNSARAAGETYAGQLQIANNAMKETEAEIGGAFLPAFTEAAPQIETMAADIGGSIAAHKQDITNAIVGITGAIKTMFDWVTQHGPEVKGILIGIASAFIIFKVVPGIINGVSKATAAFGTVAAVVQGILSPTTLIILGIVAAIATLALSVDVMKTHWSDFANKFSADGKLLVSVAGVVQSVLTSVISDINAAIAQVVENIGGNLLGAISALLSGLSGIPGVGTFLGQGASTIASAKSQIDDYYKDSITMAALAQKEIGKSAAAVGDAWNKQVAAASKDRQDYASTVKGLKDQITGFFTSTGSELSKSASDAAKKAAQEAQAETNKLLNQANKANTAGVNAGGNYTKGVSSGVTKSRAEANATGQKLATYVADGFNAKPFVDKINQIIKTAGTNSAEGTKKITAAVNEETKSIENNRDAAIKKLQAQLKGLTGSETSSTRSVENAYSASASRISSKSDENYKADRARLKNSENAQLSSIKTQYANKKAAIDNEINLRKEQAKKEIEQIKSIGEAAKTELEKEIEDRKQFVTSVNDLEKNIEGALKSRYESEEKAQESTLNNRLKSLDTWKDKAEKETNDYYDSAEAKAEEAATVQEAAIQKQIDALDKESTAEDRAAKLKEFTDKITDLQKQIAFSHDDYNKSQLQKSLDSTTADYQKQIADYAKEDKKSALQAQLEQIKTNLDAQKKAMEAEKKAELADIDEIYNTKKERLNNQLSAIKDYYAKAEESANLEAEAEKMIMQNNQNDIVALLNSYGDAYKTAGATLGDMLVQGFQPYMKTIQNMIDGVNNALQQAAQAAIQAKTQLLDTERTGSRMTDSRSYSTKVYVGSSRSSASEISRQNDNVMRRMARGLG